MSDELFKVIIVDDEAVFREYLRTKFDWISIGIKVCGEAKNGNEALEMALKVRPDIALVDINMPYMDGLKLSEKLKEAMPEIAIILITGYSEFEYAQKAVKLGVNDYILKPFEDEELRDVLLKSKGAILKSKEEKAVAAKLLSFKEMPRKESIEALHTWSMDIFMKTIDCCREGRNTRSSKIVDSVKEYIHKHYCDSELCIEHIASSLYINPDYLRAVFRKETGITVIEYLTWIRMQKARELLATGNIKLSSVSEMVGFSDASYFSKSFKKYFGMSPSEYENALK